MNGEPEQIPSSRPALVVRPRVIDFEPFFAALERHVPDITVALEVEDRIEIKVRDLRKLVARFA